MARPGRVVMLSPEEHETLRQMREHAPKPYLRERAAAVLKVAAGLPVRRVAQERLLGAHTPDTVGAWLDRYAQQGIAGWYIRKGRGRKPAFSPSVPHRRRRTRGA